MTTTTTRRVSSYVENMGYRFCPMCGADLIWRQDQEQKQRLTCSRNTRLICSTPAPTSTSAPISATGSASASASTSASASASASPSASPSASSPSASPCSYVCYANPIPVVGAIVEHTDGTDTAIVLVRSHGWPEGFYGLVTGFLESGENVESGLLREVREETGLDATIVGLIGIYDFKRSNQILLIYHVRASGAITLDSTELAGYKRVPIHRLRPWKGGTGQAVADFLERYKYGQQQQQQHQYQPQQQPVQSKL